MHIKQTPSGAPAELAYDPTDARTRIVEADKKRDRQRELIARFGPGAIRSDAETSNKEVFGFMMAVLVTVLVIAGGASYGAIKFAHKFGSGEA